MQQTELLSDDGQQNVLCIERKSTRSLMSALLTISMRPFKGVTFTSPTVYGPGSPPLNIPASIRKSSEIRCSERLLASIMVYDIGMTNPEGQGIPHDHVQMTSTAQRICYIAGGTWRQPPSSHHWRFLQELLRHLHPGSQISLISVPLSPANTAPTSLPILRKCLEALDLEAQEAKQQLIWAGDSSGGNIILGLLYDIFMSNETTSVRPMSDY